MTHPFSAARWERYCETYVMMAERANYRPQAPGDGMGHVCLSREELADSERLTREAAAYAIRFNEEEDTRKFNIGCSTFETNRAFIMVVEAARALAGNKVDLAVNLLSMVVDELSATQRRRAVTRKEREEVK